MQSKTLVTLAIATLGIGGIAWWKLSSDQAAVTSQAASGKLFPELEARINDVSTIVIERASGTLTLQRSATGWGVLEKKGYPVEMESVRKSLIALAQMTTLEAKTDNPERYSKLGVEELSAAGSSSALVTLKDAGGKELAKLYVGKEQEGKGSLPSGNVYVRRAGEKLSYLAKGNPDFKPNALDWLKKEILKVARDRVQSVSITHPDGELVRVERAKPQDNDFQLVPMPEGKELIYPGAPGSVSSTLEWLNLEDVLPAAEVDFSTEAGAKSEYRTFDGLVVRVQLKDTGDKCYARFEASYEAPVVIGPEASTTAEAAPSNPPKPEEIQKEAEALQARLKDWVFVIPAYNKASFAKRITDLVKDPAPPAPAPGSGGDETMKIPDNLPPEIQEQIKAHQESLGNKTEVVPTPTPSEEPKDHAPHDQEPK
jgi:Domain of unknown function (DUF4340)